MQVEPVNKKVTRSYSIPELTDTQLREWYDAADGRIPMSTYVEWAVDCLSAEIASHGGFHAWLQIKLQQSQK